MTIRTFDAVPVGTLPGATLFQLNEQRAEEGELCFTADYKKLEAELNDILDMLTKLDNDLGYGLIPDEYAYDRVGEILERYRNVSGN